MTSAMMTSSSTTSPATVSIADELSGPQWVSRFPGSNRTDTLIDSFRDSCNDFIAAIRNAGGTVVISATLRPPERAYLMHWAHKIYRNNVPPSEVPRKPGVHIDWVHPTLAQSREAARRMIQGYGIGGLAAHTPPSLNTLHTRGEAIDMTISWAGSLEIKNMDGSITTIASLPRTGMNVELKSVGLTYGVKKFVGGASDRPHWSTTGH